jgi:hypothetical protein
MNFLRTIWDIEEGGNVEHIDDDTILPVTAYEVPEP